MSNERDERSELYRGATIQRIARGRPLHARDTGPEHIYAVILSESGELLVSATLDYCVDVLKKRLP